MRGAVAAAAAHADVVVMAAAVADFRPAARVPGKLARREAAPSSLPLAVNADVLAELGRTRRGARPMLVGFAAESATGGAAERDPAAALLARARAKLAEKGCDLIVANDIGAPGLGFGSDSNAVTLVAADGSVESLGPAPKTELAEALWDRLVARLRGGAAGDREPAAPLPPGRRRRLGEARPAAARAGRQRRGRRA